MPNPQKPRNRPVVVGDRVHDLDSRVGRRIGRVTHVSPNYTHIMWPNGRSTNVSLSRLARGALYYIVEPNRLYRDESEDV